MFFFKKGVFNTIAPSWKYPCKIKLSTYCSTSLSLRYILVKQFIASPKYT